MKKKKRSLRKRILYAVSFLFLLLAGGLMISFYLTIPESIEDAEYDLGDLSNRVVLTDRIEYNLEEMLAQNEDFAGWIMIPDTVISLPVVQGDDNDFYLKHGFTKAKSSFGCPFLDFETQKEDKNKVIHGHNMGGNSDKIFSTLVEYQNREYAENHKYIYFSEPDVEGQIYEVFAVMNFDLRLLDEQNYMRHNFETDEEYREFVKFLKEHAVYASPDYTPRDTSLLILSTCNRQYGGNNRLLICAGKLQEDELEVTVSPSEILHNRVKLNY